MQRLPARRPSVRLPLPACFLPITPCALPFHSQHDDAVKDETYEALTAALGGRESATGGCQASATLFTLARGTSGLLLQFATCKHRHEAQGCVGMQRCALHLACNPVVERCNPPVAAAVAALLLLPCLPASCCLLRLPASSCPLIPCSAADCSVLQQLNNVLP